MHVTQRFLEKLAILSTMHQPLYKLIYLSTNKDTAIDISSISPSQLNIHTEFKAFCQKKVRTHPLVLRDECIFMCVSLNFCLILCSDLGLQDTKKMKITDTNSRWKAPKFLFHENAALTTSPRSEITGSRVSCPI